MFDKGAEISEQTACLSSQHRNVEIRVGGLEQRLSADVVKRYDFRVRRHLI